MTVTLLPVYLRLVPRITLVRFRKNYQLVRFYWTSGPRQDVSDNAYD